MRSERRAATSRSKGSGTDRATVSWGFRGASPNGGVARGTRGGRARARIATALFGVTWACAVTSPGEPAGLRTIGAADLHGHDGPLAIIHANVLTMRGASVLRGGTVVIRDGRIAEVRPATSEQALPADVRIVDAEGRYLVPGLADMHVHISAADAPAYLRNGVTTVRDMWGGAGTAALREAAASGEPVPTVIAASPAVDGSPPVREGAIILDEPDSARALVDGLIAAQWDAVKVYQNLGLPEFQALGAAAREAGIDLVGHVPTAVPLGVALENMRSIEHLEGYDKALAGHRERAFMSWAAVDTAGMANWAERTREAGVWNTPTLVVSSRVVSRALDPDDAGRAIDHMRLMVRSLKRAGAPLLAGTDAGVPLVEAGISLHEELQELVAAGLNPREALEAATSNAARFLGQDGEFGVVAPGARADLLLVDGNPLDDLSVLRFPRVVILKGRWLDAGRAVAADTTRRS